MKNIWQWFKGKNKICCGLSTEPNFLAAAHVHHHHQQWFLHDYHIQTGSSIAAFCRKESSFEARDDAWRHFASDLKKEGNLALALPTAMMAFHPSLPTSAGQSDEEAANNACHAEQLRQKESSLCMDFSRQSNDAPLVWAAMPASWAMAYQDIFTLFDWHLNRISPDDCALLNAWLWLTPTPQNLNLLIDVSFNSTTLFIVDGTHLRTRYHSSLGLQWLQHDPSSFTQQLSSELHTLFRFFQADHAPNQTLHWHVSGVDETYLPRQYLPENQSVSYWCAADQLQTATLLRERQTWQQEKHLLNRAIGIAITELENA